MPDKEKNFLETVCPVCCLELDGTGALSRIDGKTKICSNCGRLEGRMSKEALKASRLDLKMGGFKTIREQFKARTGAALY